MNRMLFCGLLSICVFPTLLYSQNLNATSELNLGIAAYDKAKYQEAIDHLERAVTLDPSAIAAHLYLARAYDSGYVENPECGEGGCVENDRRGVRAKEEYDKVLEFDPSSIEALKALAWRYLQSAKFDKADHYYRRVLEADPNEVEALYTLAVIQWTRSYQIRQEKRAELKVGQNKSLINSSLCAEIRVENLGRVEEGMTLLKRAVELVKSYDAETYMSLLYQERADIQCGDKSAYDQDISYASQWAERACKTRSDTNRNAAIPCTSLRCPPPPPPPPPGQPGSCPD